MKQKRFYGWACLTAMLVLFALPAAAVENTLPADGAEIPAQVEEVSLPADGTEIPVQEEEVSLPLPQMAEAAAGEQEPATEDADILQGSVDVTEELYQFGCISADWPTPLALTDEAYTLPGTGSPEWQTLQKGLEDWQASIDLSAYKIPRAEIGHLWRDFINANPRFFYLTGYMEYSYRLSDGTVTTIKPEYDPTYTQADTKAYEIAVRKAVDSLPQGLELYQQALVLHDYLAQHCAYDTNYQNYNAYNALVEHSAVCNGYMLAYRDLMNRINIPSGTVTSEVMNHTWNVIQLDGKWYHIDVTWDDPLQDVPGRAMHEFFLLSDDAMKNAGWSAEKHRDWTAEVTCVDTRFDKGQIWSGVDSALVFYNGSIYYISGAGNVVRRAPDGTITTLRETYTYNDYTMISAGQDCLYYNDLMNVRRISLPDETVQTVYACKDRSESILGCMHIDGVLYILLNDGSDQNTLVTYPLSEEIEPHPLPDGYNIKDGLLLGVEAGTSVAQMEQMFGAGVQAQDANKHALAPGANIGTGCRVKLPGQEDFLTVMIPCDVDGTGRIDLFDLIEARKAVLDVITLEDVYLQAAQPTNGGGTAPSLFDIIEIRKVLLGAR